MITLKLRHCIFAGVGLLSFALVGVAYANPSRFGPTVSTNSAASTSPAYIIAGVSTSTTPNFDTASTSMAVAGGATYKTDNATLLVQFNGSSTASVLNMAVEYSNDCIDWYRSYILDMKTIGTTTPTISVGNTLPFSYQMKAASTTVGGAGLNATNGIIETAAMSIPTPTRCTRVVSTLTGGNGAVWTQIVPIQETR